MCGSSFVSNNGRLDMLHLGYVDEVLFGREIVERMPDLVKDWVAIARRRNEV
jgi:hypothetical protein